MKMHIIVNDMGEIIGTAPVEPVQTEGEAPTNIALIPEQGQLIYEVEVPDKVLEMSAMELHDLYRVDIKRPIGELVELKKR